MYVHVYYYSVYCKFVNMKKYKVTCIEKSALIQNENIYYLFKKFLRKIKIRWFASIQMKDEGEIWGPGPPLEFSLWGPVFFCEIF